MDTMHHDIQIFHIAQTDSTNEEVKRRRALSPRCRQTGEGGEALCVWADYQTSGRGQKGARWEAERGKNLLFSILVEPRTISVERQFVLSQAMALAVHDAVAECVEQRSGCASKVHIKWPNDIYFGERKLCGTIIECTLHGRMVERCAIGVGINVNQRTFHGNAPNPVSLCSIVGGEVEREGLLCAVLERFCANLALAQEGGSEIAERYRKALMRTEGIHLYRDAQGLFEAEYAGVEHDGHLLLRDTARRLRRYYFKEVRHVFRNLETE